MASRVLPSQWERRRQGETLVWQVTLTPPESIAGQTLAVAVLDAPPAWTGWPGGTPPAPVETDVPNGVFRFTIDTTAFPPGVYRLAAGRTSAAPVDMSELCLVVTLP